MSISEHCILLSSFERGLLKKELKKLKASGLFNDFEKVKDNKLKKRPLDGKPLGGKLEGLLRIKLLKDWRIIYQVESLEQVVWIVSVIPRKDAYIDEDELLSRLDYKESHEPMQG